MRNLSELLQIMLDNKEAFWTGLCQWNAQLSHDGILTGEEERRIKKYIVENRPSMFSSIAAFKSRQDMYYWPSCDIKPRIKWLKKHIKKQRYHEQTKN